MESEHSNTVIVIAEDSPADAFLIRRAIHAHLKNYDLLVLEDGEKAMRMIEETDRRVSDVCPCALLLDWNLPRRSGAEILSRWRMSPKCGEIPIIVMTSSDSPQDREDAAQLGATNHFRKPNDLQSFMELGAIVRELLASRREPSRLQ